MLMALLSPFAGILLYKLTRRYLPNCVAGIAKFMMLVAAGSLLGLHVICFLVVFRHLPLLGGQFMWLLIAAFETSIFYVALYVNGSPFGAFENDGRIFLSVNNFRAAFRCLFKK
jgi:hypothetical protein